MVSGGVLVLDGVDRIAAASALNLGGGKLALMNGIGANAQTFASLTLSASSALGLGGSSITFNGLGSIATGATLTITGASLANSPTYAIRVLGDHSSDTAFRALLAGTTIDGAAATYTFDGVYTDIASVSAVPEPSTLALMLAGVGLVGLSRRRKS